MAESENVADAAVMSEAEANNTVVGKTSKEAEKWFKRLDKGKKELSGTVPPYQRHVFFCYKNPESWPPRFHKSEINTFPKPFMNYVLARRFDLAVKTMFTVCESREDMGFDDGDVLIFPDMIKYKRLKESEFRGFIDDVLVKGIPWVFGPQEKLTGSHIFVCAHGSRRKIDGVCGPVLIDKLNEGIEARGLKEVYVSGCSDIKGHVYAPNVIVYRSDSQERVTGHWYGYVTPDDVPDILDQHIVKGDVLEHKLRGQAGYSMMMKTTMKRMFIASVQESL